MEKHFNMLGCIYTDVITGTTGVVDSLCFDLYGCVQASLREKTRKDGTIPDARWYDVSRLKLASKKRVMEIPTLYKFHGEQPKSYVPAGPADKPLRRG